MNVCTCLWGGQYNPIIPICDAVPDAWKASSPIGVSGVELTMGYIQFFEPDVFVEAEDGLAAAAKVPTETIDFHYPRVLPLRAFFEDRKDERSGVPFGLSMFDIYEHLYAREFRFVSRHEHRVAVVTSSDDDAPFTEAVYGCFPESGYLSPLGKRYTAALDPKKFTSNVETWSRFADERHYPPLALTRYGIEIRYPHSDGQTIFIFDPSSALDLIDFWNLRQFNHRILPVNAGWIDSSREFLHRLIRTEHQPTAGAPSYAYNRLVLQFGRSIDAARSKDIIEELRLRELPEGSWGYQPFYESIWKKHNSDFIAAPIRARLSAGEKSLELPTIDHNSEPAIRFETITPDFVRLRGNNPASWVNILRLRSHRSNNRLALSLPVNFPTEKMRHLRIGGSTLLSREGFVLPQRHKAHGEYLQLLSAGDAIQAWLEKSGVPAKQSKSGRVAEQILDAIGGLWRCHLLADKETLVLLDRMSKSVRRHPDNTIEEFADRSVDVRTWISLIERRKSSALGHLIELDAFIKANVLKLGLGIECPACSKQNWYGVDDLRLDLKCDQCLKPFQFPQGTLDFNKTPWKYRIVGPFTVPDFADGGYSTLLTLRALLNLGGGDADMIFSAGLDLAFSQEPAAEQNVDLALWYRRGDLLGESEEEYSLVFGEAKSFGSHAFHDDDVARMRKVAEQFPGAFLVFSTLKTALSDPEKALIGELARWGFEMTDNGMRARVIVLTGHELFAPWQIEEAWKTLGGLHKKFADMSALRLDNLENIADLSQQLYLGLPSFSERLRADRTNMRPPQRGK